ncbi:MAG: glutamine synthetase type III, partial [Gillisia sp.]
MDDFEKHSKEQIQIIKEISEHIEHINADITKMIDARKKANLIEDAEKRAFAYCDDVKSYFEEIRYHCDKLELLVDDELWPLTKYRELLFTK